MLRCVHLSVCLFRFPILFRSLDSDVHSSPFQTHPMGDSTVGLLSAGGELYRFATINLVVSGSVLCENRRLILNIL